MQFIMARYSLTVLKVPLNPNQSICNLYAIVSTLYNIMFMFYEHRMRGPEKPKTYI